jgi:hypothetical protein
MLRKISTSPSGRTIALALACAAILLCGFLVGRATAAQPHMQSALDHLKAAKAELQVAEENKGGHRTKALNLVNQAITEVEAGINYAAAH